MKAGWEVRPLGEVCDFKGGSQPPKSQFVSEPKDGYIRMLQIRDFKSDNKAVYIPVTPKTNACEAEDIMIGRYGASVGQIHRGKTGAYNVALIRTIPDLSRIDRDFLYYYLTSDLFQKPLLSVSKRGAQDGFSKPDIAPFPLPIPPLEEQKQIVAVLDAAFEGLTRAKENAEANLQNARELYRGTLSALTLHSLDCQQKKLSELVREDSPITYGVVKPGPEGNVPFVRGGDLRDGEIDVANLRTITEETSSGYTRTRLHGGELLICLVGQPGQTGIVPPELINANIARQTALVRLAEGALNEYVSFFLLSDEGQNRLGAYTQGSIQQVINLRDLKDIIVPVPAVSRQVEIAKLCSDAREQVRNIAHSYTTKLTNIADLRQSLLQKAFAGELT